MRDDPFVHWIQALDARHLDSLSFSEVRRAVQALSSLYVERRGRIDTGAAFTGAGKRAAFAMYFGPLHFLLVREIVRALEAEVPKRASILDLGCGTGVAGAAWALECDRKPRVVGAERNPWALEECKWTYQQLRVQGTARSADLNRLRIPAAAAVIAAFTMNELDPVSRDRFRRNFIKVARTGVPVLIVEPIARRLATWWTEWAEEWKPAGGRSDEWRFRIELPELVSRMDKAAGLDHRELTGRSLWLPGVA
jgi:hypothetical protein